MEQPKISGYIVTGFNVKFYCKLSELYLNTPNYQCVISFGMGMKQFCMTAIYKKIKPNEIYIDRVQNNDLCVFDGKLRNYDKGTVKIVKTSLYFIKQLFPDVTTITLFDDSQIYCEENSMQFKLSMSYDYILKYNETWYQKNFNAELPGFISKQYTNKNIFPIIESEPDSLMDKYNSSLKILDEPLMNYYLILNIFPQFSQYKDEYETSKSPRDFINKLRKKLGNQFCFIVGKWLNQYMLHIQIKFIQSEWYILTTNIQNVPNFSMLQINNKNAKRILDGGSKTYKNKKPSGFKIIADSNFTESFIDSFDNYSKYD